MIQRLAYLVLLMVLMGCGHDGPTAPSEPVSARGAHCRIERATEAEAVLAQLGTNAWVFRHSGCDLMPVLKVAYKPASSDALEKTLFEADGDRALRLKHSHDPARNENDVLNGGFIVVTFPDAGFSQQELGLRFSIDGAHTTHADRDAIPLLVHEGPVYWSGGGTLLDESIVISPDESRNLCDWTFSRSNTSPTLPEEQESIRYVWTVTALREGEQAYLGPQ